MQMLICGKKPELYSDAAQNTRRLIRAYSFCSSISRCFPDSFTYVHFESLSMTTIQWICIEHCGACAKCLTVN